MTPVEKKKLNELISKGEKIANAKGEDFNQVLLTFFNGYIFENIDYVINKVEKLEKRTNVRQ